MAYCYFRGYAVGFLLTFIVLVQAVQFDAMRSLERMRQLYVTAFLAAAFTLSPALLEAAEKTCSTATLQGAFGYTVTGFFPGGVPFAAVGKIVFNGSGLVTTTRTLSNGGTIVRANTGSGTYSINADCTGSFTITAGGLGQLELDIVLDDEADQIRGIAVNPGLVLTLEGRKQGKK